LNIGVRKHRGPMVERLLATSFRYGDRNLVGKDVPAVLGEEGVVVTLVRILGVVVRLRASVRDMLFGVDRSDRTDVGLIARGT
jgi:hypothetical protein